MEDIACRRIIDDNRVTDRPPQLGEVLHIVSFMVVARFSEQSVLDHSMDI